MSERGEEEKEKKREMSEREEVKKERMRGERKRICKERGKKKEKSTQGIKEKQADHSPHWTHHYPVDCFSSQPWKAGH